MEIAKDEALIALSEPVKETEKTAPIIPKAEPVVVQEPMEQPVDEIKKPEPVVQTAPEKEEDVWASIKGMRNSATIIAELEAVGIMTFADFSIFFIDIQHSDDHTKEVEILKKQINSAKE